MPAERRRVVILGGGITGLSLAYYLDVWGTLRDLSLEYTLVESAPVMGGKIRTSRRGAHDAFVLEQGPDSILTGKPWALELIRELGLEDELIGINPLPESVAVLVGGKLHPLPEGMVLGVPTRWGPMLRSDLFSPFGKARMGLDLLLPARKSEDDESVGSFIRRRLGREALERLAEPLLAGIYSADVERLSLLATFPQLRDLERHFGSLSRGMLASGRQVGKGRSPVFYSLRSGMDCLVDALAARVADQTVAGVAATTLTRSRAEGSRRWLVGLQDGRALAADHVVLALPSFAAADVVQESFPELAEELRGIRYTSTAVVNLGYREDQLTSRFHGYGIVIPRTEQRRINALTISSRKFNYRAPEWAVLVRAFLGGSRAPELLTQSDEALAAIACSETAAVLGLRGEPMFSEVSRWMNASPQYEVGHLRRVEHMERLCPPGLYLCGSAYRGVGIPDCVRQAKGTAARLAS